MEGITPLTISETDSTFEIAEESAEFNIEVIPETEDSPLAIYKATTVESDDGSYQANEIEE